MVARKKKGLFLNHDGFTVMELMAVLGIFAIVSAIAVPNFVAQLPTYQLNGAARLVLGELMWARSKAVAEGNQFIVSFPNNASLTILDDDNNSGLANAGEWTRTRNIQTDYPGVTLSKSVGDPNPTFVPRGTAGGTTTITVTNSSGSRTVTVNINGNVKIN